MKPELLPVTVLDKDSKYSVNYDYATGDAIIRVAVNHIMPSTIQQMIMEAVQAAVRNHPYYTTEIETMVKDAFQSQIEDIVAKETKKLVDEQVSKHKRIETTSFPPTRISPGTSTPYNRFDDWAEPTDFWPDETRSAKEFFAKLELTERDKRLKTNLLEKLEKMDKAKTI